MGDSYLVPSAIRVLGVVINHHGFMEIAVFQGKEVCRYTQPLLAARQETPNPAPLCNYTQSINMISKRQIKTNIKHKMCKNDENSLKAH
eukprot:748152-Pyramimonas_sp.AAC.1